MEASLIILRKNNETLDLSFRKKINDVFKDLFYEVNEKELIISINNKYEKVNYLLSRNNHNTIFLKISCNKSEAKSAEAISHVIDKIQSCRHKGNLNIVVTYDGSSLYYCCKLMKGFGLFERKIREFIYITLINILGISWFEKTFTTELENSIKGRLSSDGLIEKALSELTYSQLMDYLFKPYPDIDNIQEFLDKTLTRDKVKVLSKDELINEINKIRCDRSLWDRFFQKYTEFDNFNNEIEELRKMRNKVMHHKQISKRDYELYNRKLKKMNKKLDIAIKYAEEDIYRSITISDIIGAFSKMSEALDKQVLGMTTALSKLSEVITKSLENSRIAEMAKVVDQNMIATKKISEALNNSISPELTNLKAVLNESLNSHEMLRIKEFQNIASRENKEIISLKNRINYSDINDGSNLFINENDLDEENK